MIYLTQVHGNFAGDTRLEGVSPAVWQEANRESRTAPDGLSYSFVTLAHRA